MLRHPFFTAVTSVSSCRWLPNLVEPLSHRSRTASTLSRESAPGRGNSQLRDKSPCQLNAMSVLKRLRLSKFIEHLFGLTVSDLQAVARQCLSAFLSVGPLNPIRFSGTSAWAAGIEVLRAILDVRGGRLGRPPLSRFLSQARRSIFVARSYVRVCMGRIVESNGVVTGLLWLSRENGDHHCDLSGFWPLCSMTPRTGSAQPKQCSHRQAPTFVPLESRVPRSTAAPAIRRPFGCWQAPVENSERLI